MPQVKQKKAWMLTPNQDFTPKGVLQLGQILTDYNDPNTALLSEGTVPVPEKALKDESIHRGVDYSSSETQQTAFVAWLKAALYLPVGGNVSGSSETASWEQFSGQTISVFMFPPSIDYVKKALALADASSLPSVPWYKTHTRIWLVTGLRVLGKGTKINEGFVRRAMGGASAEGDATAAQVPVSGGVGAQHSESSAQTHQLQDSDPFVYCYRLHEVIIKRKLADAQWRAFTQGHIQDAGQGGSSQESGNGEPEIIGYEVINVDNDVFDCDGNENNPMFVE